jgi:hypothetical protein
VPQFILGYGFRVINLVAEDQEGNLGELLEVEELVEGVLGFGEAVDVFCVNEVDYAVYFGEVLGIVLELGGRVVVVGVVKRTSRHILRACKWPPKSKVVKRQLPMESSSLAGVVLDHAVQEARACSGDRTWVESRLEDSDLRRVSAFRFEDCCRQICLLGRS